MQFFKRSRCVEADIAGDAQLCPGCPIIRAVIHRGQRIGMFGSREKGACRHADRTAKHDRAALRQHGIGSLRCRRRVFGGRAVSAAAVPDKTDCPRRSHREGRRNPRGKTRICCGQYHKFRAVAVLHHKRCKTAAAERQAKAIRNVLHLHLPYTAAEQLDRNGFAGQRQ